MQRCILGSQIFLNKEVITKVFSIIEKDILETKVLFIPNEKVTLEKIESGKYVKRLEEWGFKKENIFVFDKDNADASKNLDIDAIIVSGGNTFGTMNNLRVSNFTNDIKNYVKNGVIYIGESAGSHIASKNFKHVIKYDSNECMMTNFEGLNLFDGIFICHFDESRREDFENLKKESNCEVYALSNNEFIDLKNGKITKYEV